MMRIISAMFILSLPLGFLSIAGNKSGFTVAMPAYAQCTTWEIKNNCCYKFFKVLEGNAAEENMQSREKKALAEFRRCLDMDVGCSSETIELKAKNVKGVRSFCK